ncbi:MAG TPA: rod shape-determining protein MreD [Pyrinomonadaceae bacterium]|nr:rod shape-determining protein MreD [Pyrinomonadaceae bacterium]
MEGVKLTIALIVAVLLQWSLRNVSEIFAYVDLPLIVIVYAALQRNSIRALIFGTLAGLSVDALSGGLLGSQGFSKTLIAFIVSEIARRVYLDNLLLRIPVLIGACVVNSLVYFGLHRLLGQPPQGDLIVVGAYSLIGTTIVGTLIYLLFESLGNERTRPKRRDVFSSRRQTRRRNPIRLAK